MGISFSSSFFIINFCIALHGTGILFCMCIISFLEYDVCVSLKADSTKMVCNDLLLTLIHIKDLKCICQSIYVIVGVPRAQVFQGKKKKKWSFGLDSHIEVKMKR